jgi:DNA (cytosine-5)-methyltransferase 1
MHWGKVKGGNAPRKFRCARLGVFLSDSAMVAAIPGFYDFFCGGGMARAGLGPEWRCLFANDVDPRKGAAYSANWGSDVLAIADVAALSAGDMPGEADLAWASFPCQDLSLAGAGAGLDGRRSGAFWGFCAAMNKLNAEGRAPRLIALENVGGVLTSKGGADFVAICGALRELGYRFGALTIDATHFLPQSRPRVFFLAVRRSLSVPARLLSVVAPAHYASTVLRRVAAALPTTLAADWLWWRAPEPPRGNVRLVDCLDKEPSRWHETRQTEALLAALSPASRRDVALARESGERCVGAVFRRTRPNGLGGVRVQAEARFDGLAGCLRTPAGGSSRQFLIEVRGQTTRTRLMSPREAARLMGLPDSFKLPVRANEALHLAGDGVAAPVVRFLSDHLLLPLLRENEEHAPPPRAGRA